MRGTPSRTGSRRFDSFLWAAVAGLAFVALAVLVGQGALGGIDSYAVHHLMPFGNGESAGTANLLLRALAYDSPTFQLGRVLRLPASALPASVLILVVCVVLWRRGRRDLAVIWLFAYGVGVTVELACKLTVTKPPIYVIYHGTVTAAGFNHSFPSGHVTRAAIVAAAVATAWPRMIPLLAVWVGVVIVTADLDAIHSPSDLLGGVLISTALILGAIGCERQFGEALNHLLRAAGPDAGSAPKVSLERQV